MKYKNLNNIFYLEDLFDIWTTEQAKEKEYKKTENMIAKVGFDTYA